MDIDSLIQGWWPGAVPPPPEPALNITESQVRSVLAKLRALPCVDIKCRNSGIGRQSIVCTRCAAVDEVESFLPKVMP